MARLAPSDPRVLAAPDKAHDQVVVTRLSSLAKTSFDRLAKSIYTLMNRGYSATRCNALFLLISAVSGDGAASL